MKPYLLYISQVTIVLFALPFILGKYNEPNFELHLSPNDSCLSGLSPQAIHYTTPPQQPIDPCPCRYNYPKSPDKYQDPCLPHLIQEPFLDSKDDSSHPPCSPNDDLSGMNPFSDIHESILAKMEKSCATSTTRRYQQKPHSRCSAVAPPSSAINTAGRNPLVSCSCGSVPELSKPGSSYQLSSSSTGSKATDWTNLIRPIPNGPSFKISSRPRLASEMRRSDGLSIDGRIGTGVGEYEVVINDSPESTYISESLLNMLRQALLEDVVYLLPYSSKTGALIDLKHYFIITEKKYYPLHPIIVEFNGDEKQMVFVLNHGKEKYLWPTQLSDISKWLSLFDLAEDLVIIINSPSSYSRTQREDVPPLIIGKEIKPYSGGKYRIYFRGGRDISINGQHSNEIKNLRLDRMRNVLQAVYSLDEYQQIEMSLSPSIALFLVKLYQNGKIFLSFVGPSPAHLHQPGSASSIDTRKRNWNSIERNVAEAMFKVSWRLRTPNEISSHQNISLEGRRSQNGPEGDYEVIVNDNQLECVFLTHAQLDVLKSTFMRLPYLINKVPGEIGAIASFQYHFLITNKVIEILTPIRFVFENDFNSLTIWTPMNERFIWIMGTGFNGYLELFQLNHFKLYFISDTTFTDQQARMTTKQPELQFLITKLSPGQIFYSILNPLNHHETPVQNIIIEPITNHLFCKDVNDLSKLIKIKLSKSAIQLLSELKRAGIVVLNYIQDESIQMQNLIRSLIEPALWNVSTKLAEDVVKGIEKGAAKIEQVGAKALHSLKNTAKTVKTAIGHAKENIKSGVKNLAHRLFK